ncbi:S8 family serine peptidase [Nitratireductor aquimarinus]|uniref:S8 family serine peptidase n=1 Tax=Nitratireductor aquimarinus TaxID=889300 RepID=UPI00293538AA|nr:S8 family serine peptidase [Nitratireductor aquimarinus]MDV2966132.1 S8 family serine peptidase [Nitratireductor aquimarinus]
MGRYCRFFLTVWLSLFLTACGGGDGEKASSVQQPEPPEQPEQPEPPVYTGGYPAFDPVAAAQYRETPEFRRSDPGEGEENHIRGQFGQPRLCSQSANPDCAGTSAYALQNIHFAHTATDWSGRPLTGHGQTIAIFDNGYRLSHRELAGKDVIRYTAPGRTIGRDSHGTAVAAIAAGAADGVGAMGVAPDARLHISSWEDVSDDDAMAHMVAAIRDAARHGAVAQNNSWGWQTEKQADAEARDFGASGTTDYARHLADRQGDDPQTWRTLFAAYDAFQKGGVLVFTNSNDRTLHNATAWAALPEFVPELAEAWIAVGNALFSVDGKTGDILDADLLSAPCGMAARYCVIADGTLRVATDVGDGSYQLGTGTSYAAPQVAGEIALLAQAFPTLSPGEWTTRLLATAQRDWDGFQNSIAGHQNFAPGVRRAYSHLYGHGVPDMKAALSPVGGLSIASGARVGEGRQTPLSAAATSAPPIVGNAVSKALSGRRIMALDALGGDFHLDGRVLAPANRMHAPSGIGVAQRLAAQQEKLDFAFAFANLPSSEWQSLHSTASAKLFFSHGFTETQDGLVLSRLMPLGAGDYLQFAGGMVERNESEAVQFALSRLTRRGIMTSEVTLSGGHGRGQLFGMSTSSPFALAESSGRFSAGATLTARLGGGWSFSGYGEVGLAHAQEGEEALIDYGALTYASGGLMLDKTGLLQAGDRARFYAGMKPNPLAGHTTLRVPVARTKEGLITYETVDVNLASGDLPARFGFSYTHRTARNFDLSLNANADLFITAPESAVTDVSINLRKSF